MIVSGFSPVHVATCVVILIISCGVFSQTKPDKCDVRMWYLDLVTDGALSGEFSEDKRTLKAKIEKMVEKYKNVGRADGLVDCSILAVYDDLLGNAPQAPTDTDKAQGGPAENNDERKPTEKKENIESGDADLKRQEDINQNDEQSDNESGDDTDLDDTDFSDDDENDDNKEVVEDSNNTEDDTSQTKENKDETKDESVNDKIKTEESEEVTTKEGSQKDKNSDTGDEAKVRKKKTRLVEEIKFDPRKGYVRVMKEVEIDDDDDVHDDQEEKKTDADEPESKKDRDTDEKNSEVKIDAKTDKNVEEDSEQKFDGIKNGEQSDTGSDSNARVADRNSVHKSIFESFKERCSQRQACNQYCFYGYSSNHCIEYYPDTYSSVRDPEVPAAATFGSVLSERHEQPVQEETTQVVNNNDVDENNAVEKTMSELTGQEDSNDKTTVSGSEMGTEETSEYDNGREKNAKTEKNENGGGNMQAKTEDFRDFTADLHRFELIFQQRAAEYANKIQSLEIMIIRLENQLLGERLNKQNNTTSFSKLENHILRLENELLKLNQSYSLLKDENDAIKFRQRKYLELGHDKSSEQSPNVNSSKHYELINNQQSKISELTSLLTNHSVLFDKLQSKSHVLEEQNQALYQIVMNQTALITSIMKKMQELSEENMRHRQETQDLRTQMEIKSNSDRLLEKLENLVSIQVPSTKTFPEEEEVAKSDKEQFNMYSFFPKSPADIVKNKPWRCDGNGSSRFCVLYSFVLSPCPPFSTIYWMKCPFFNKDISEMLHKSLQESVDNTSEDKDDRLHSFVDTHSIPQGTNNEENIISKEIATDVSHDNERVSEQNTNGDETPQNENINSQKENTNTDREETPQNENTSLHEGIKTEETTFKVEESHGSTSDNQSEDRNQSPGAEDKADLPEGNKDTSAPSSGQTVDSPNDQKVDKTSEAKDSADLPPADEVKVTARAPPTKETQPAPPPEQREIIYKSENTLPKPKDCYGYYKKGNERNGMYKIYVVGLEKHLPVYCDMRGGGWTVIMKRSNGGIDFYRDWENYKRGFGGFYSEHWIGNDNLHYLTNQDHYSLRVKLEDFSATDVEAIYEHFWIDNEAEGYRLHIDGYSGDAGDGFAKHNNMKFSTYDVDNDLVTKELKEHDSSCAKRFKGAWWYYKCYMSNLTGKYYKKGDVPDKKYDGVSWKPWKKPNISLKTAVMMIRPSNSKE